MESGRCEESEHAFLNVGDIGNEWKNVVGHYRELRKLLDSCNLEARHSWAIVEKVRRSASSVTLELSDLEKELSDDFMLTGCNVDSSCSRPKSDLKYVRLSRQPSFTSTKETSPPLIDDELEPKDCRNNHHQKNRKGLLENGTSREDSTKNLGKTGSSKWSDDYKNRFQKITYGKKNKYELSDNYLKKLGEQYQGSKESPKPRERYIKMGNSRISTDDTNLFIKIRSNCRSSISSKEFKPSSPKIDPKSLIPNPENLQIFKEHTYYKLSLLNDSSCFQNLYYNLLNKSKSEHDLSGSNKGQNSLNEVHPNMDEIKLLLDSYITGKNQVSKSLSETCIQSTNICYPSYYEKSADIEKSKSEGHTDEINVVNCSRCRKVMNAEQTDTEKSINRVKKLICNEQCSKLNKNSKKKGCDICMMPKESLMTTKRSEISIANSLSSNVSKIKRNLHKKSSSSSESGIANDIISNSSAKAFGTPKDWVEIKAYTVPVEKENVDNYSVDDDDDDHESVNKSCPIKRSPEKKKTKDETLESPPSSDEPSCSNIRASYYLKDSKRHNDEKRMREAKDTHSIRSEKSERNPSPNIYTVDFDDITPTRIYKIPFEMVQSECSTAISDKHCDIRTEKPKSKGEKTKARKQKKEALPIFKDSNSSSENENKQGSRLSTIETSKAKKGSDVGKSMNWTQNFPFTPCNWYTTYCPDKKCYINKYPISSKAKTADPKHKEVADNKINNDKKDNTPKIDQEKACNNTSPPNKSSPSNKPKCLMSGQTNGGIIDKHLAKTFHKKSVDVNTYGQEEKKRQREKPRRRLVTKSYRDSIDLGEPAENARGPIIGTRLDREEEKENRPRLKSITKYPHMRSESQDELSVDFIDERPKISIRSLSTFERTKVGPSSYNTVINDTKYDKNDEIRGSTKAKRFDREEEKENRERFKRLTKYPSQRYDSQDELNADYIDENLIGTKSMSHLKTTKVGPSPYNKVNDPKSDKNSEMRGSRRNAKFDRKEEIENRERFKRLTKYPSQRFGSQEELNTDYIDENLIGTRSMSLIKTTKVGPSPCNKCNDPKSDKNSEMRGSRRNAKFDRKEEKENRERFKRLTKYPSQRFGSHEELNTDYIDENLIGTRSMSLIKTTKVGPSPCNKCNAPKSDKKDEMRGSMKYAKFDRIEEKENRERFKRLSKHPSQRFGSQHELSDDCIHEKPNIHKRSTSSLEVEVGAHNYNKVNDPKSDKKCELRGSKRIARFGREEERENKPTLKNVTKYPSPRLQIPNELIENFLIQRRNNNKRNSVGITERSIVEPSHNQPYDPKPDKKDDLRGSKRTARFDREEDRDNRQRFKSVTKFPSQRFDSHDELNADVIDQKHDTCRRSTSLVRLTDRSIVDESKVSIDLFNRIEKLKSTTGNVGLKTKRGYLENKSFDSLSSADSVVPDESLYRSLMDEADKIKKLATKSRKKLNYGNQVDGRKVKSYKKSLNLSNNTEIGVQCDFTPNYKRPAMEKLRKSSYEAFGRTKSQSKYGGLVNMKGKYASGQNTESYRTAAKNTESYRTAAKNTESYRTPAKNTESYRTPAKNTESYRTATKNTESYRTAKNIESYRTAAKNTESYRTAAKSRKTYNDKSRTSNISTAQNKAALLRNNKPCLQKDYPLVKKTSTRLTTCANRSMRCKYPQPMCCPSRNFCRIPCGRLNRTRSKCTKNNGPVVCIPSRPNYYNCTGMARKHVLQTKTSSKRRSIRLPHVPSFPKYTRILPAGKTPKRRSPLPTKTLSYPDRRASKEQVVMVEGTPMCIPNRVGRCTSLPNCCSTPAVCCTPNTVPAVCSGQSICGIKWDCADPIECCPPKPIKIVPSVCCGDQNPCLTCNYPIARSCDPNPCCCSTCCPKVIKTIAPPVCCTDTNPLGMTWTLNNNFGRTKYTCNAWPGVVKGLCGMRTKICHNQCTFHLRIQSSNPCVKDLTSAKSDKQLVSTISQSDKNDECQQLTKQEIHESVNVLSQLKANSASNPSRTKCVYFMKELLDNSTDNTNKEECEVKQMTLSSKEPSSSQIINDSQCENDDKININRDNSNTEDKNKKSLLNSKIITSLEDINCHVDITCGKALNFTKKTKMEEKCKKYYSDLNRFFSEQVSSNHEQNGSKVVKFCSCSKSCLSIQSMCKCKSPLSLNQLNASHSGNDDNTDKINVTREESESEGNYNKTVCQDKTPTSASEKSFEKVQTHEPSRVYSMQCQTDITCGEEEEVEEEEKVEEEEEKVEEEEREEEETIIIETCELNEKVSDPSVDAEGSPNNCEECNCGTPDNTEYYLGQSELEESVIQTDSQGLPENIINLDDSKSIVQTNLQPNVHMCKCATNLHPEKIKTDQSNRGQQKEKERAKNTNSNTRSLEREYRKFLGCDASDFIQLLTSSFIKSNILTSSTKKDQSTNCSPARQPSVSTECNKTNQTPKMKHQEKTTPKTNLCTSCTQTEGYQTLYESNALDYSSGPNSKLNLIQRGKLQTCDLALQTSQTDQPSVIPSTMTLCGLSFPSANNMLPVEINKKVDVPKHPQTEVRLDKRNNFNPNQYFRNATKLPPPVNTTLQNFSHDSKQHKTDQSQSPGLMDKKKDMSNHLKNKENTDFAVWTLPNDKNPKQTEIEMDNYFNPNQYFPFTPKLAPPVNTTFKIFSHDSIQPKTDRAHSPGVLDKENNDFALWTLPDDKIEHMIIPNDLQAEVDKSNYFNPDQYISHKTELPPPVDIPYLNFSHDSKQPKTDRAHSPGLMEKNDLSNHLKNKENDDFAKWTLPGDKNEQLIAPKHPQSELELDESNYFNPNKYFPHTSKLPPPGNRTFLNLSPDSKQPKTDRSHSPGEMENKKDWSDHPKNKENIDFAVWTIPDDKKELITKHPQTEIKMDNSNHFKPSLSPPVKSTLLNFSHDSRQPKADRSHSPGVIEMNKDLPNHPKNKENTEFAMWTLPDERLLKDSKKLLFRPNDLVESVKRKTEEVSTCFAKWTLPDQRTYSTLTAKSHSPLLNRKPQTAEKSKSCPHGLDIKAKNHEKGSKGEKSKMSTKKSAKEINLGEGGKSEKNMTDFRLMPVLIENDRLFLPTKIGDDFSSDNSQHDFSKPAWRNETDVHSNFTLVENLPILGNKFESHTVSNLNRKAGKRSLSKTENKYKSILKRSLEKTNKLNTSKDNTTKPTKNRICRVDRDMMGNLQTLNRQKDEIFVTVEVIKDKNFVKDIRSVENFAIEKNRSNTTFAEESLKMEESIATCQKNIQELFYFQEASESQKNLHSLLSEKSRKELISFQRKKFAGKQMQHNRFEGRKMNNIHFKKYPVLHTVFHEDDETPKKHNLSRKNTSSDECTREIKGRNFLESLDDSKLRYNSILPSKSPKSEPLAQKELEQKKKERKSVRSTNLTQSIPDNKPMSGSFKLKFRSTSATVSGSLSRNNSNTNGSRASHSCIQFDSPQDCVVMKNLIKILQKESIKLNGTKNYKNSSCDKGPCIEKEESDRIISSRKNSPKKSSYSCDSCERSKLLKSLHPQYSKVAKRRVNEYPKNPRQNDQQLRRSERESMKAVMDMLLKLLSPPLSEKNKEKANNVLENTTKKEENTTERKKMEKLTTNRVITDRKIESIKEQKGPREQKILPNIRMKKRSRPIFVPCKKTICKTHSELKSEANKLKQVGNVGNLKKINKNAESNKPCTITDGDTSKETSYFRNNKSSVRSMNSRQRKINNIRYPVIRKAQPTEKLAKSIRFEEKKFKKSEIPTEKYKMDKSPNKKRDDVNKNNSQTSISLPKTIKRFGENVKNKSRTLPNRSMPPSSFPSLKRQNILTNSNIINQLIEEAKESEKLKENTKSNFGCSYHNESSSDREVDDIRSTCEYTPNKKLAWFGIRNPPYFASIPESEQEGDNEKLARSSNSKFIYSSSIKPVMETSIKKEMEYLETYFDSRGDLTNKPTRTRNDLQNKIRMKLKSETFSSFLKDKTKESVINRSEKEKGRKEKFGVVDRSKDLFRMKHSSRESVKSPNKPKAKPQKETFFTKTKERNITRKPINTTEITHSDNEVLNKLKFLTITESPQKRAHSLPNDANEERPYPKQRSLGFPETNNIKENQDSINSFKIVDINKESVYNKRNSRSMPFYNPYEAKLKDINDLLDERTPWLSTLKSFKNMANDISGKNFEEYCSCRSVESIPPILKDQYSKMKRMESNKLQSLGPREFSRKHCECYHENNPENVINPVWKIEATSEELYNKSENLFDKIQKPTIPQITNQDNEEKFEFDEAVHGHYQYNQKYGTQENKSVCCKLGEDDETTSESSEGMPTTKNNNYNNNYNNDYKKQLFDEEHKHIECHFNFKGTNNMPDMYVNQAITKWQLTESMEDMQKLGQGPFYQKKEKRISPERIVKSRDQTNRRAKCRRGQTTHYIPSKKAEQLRKELILMQLETEKRDNSPSCKNFSKIANEPGYKVKNKNKRAENSNSKQKEKYYLAKPSYYYVLNALHNAGDSPKLKCLNSYFNTLSEISSLPGNKEYITNSTLEDYLKALKTLSKKLCNHIATMKMGLMKSNLLRKSHRTKSGSFNDKERRKMYESSVGGDKSKQKTLGYPVIPRKDRLKMLRQVHHELGRLKLKIKRTHFLDFKKIVFTGVQNKDKQEQIIKTNQKELAKIRSIEKQINILDNEILKQTGMENRKLQHENLRLQERALVKEKQEKLAETKTRLNAKLNEINDLIEYQIQNQSQTEKAKTNGGIVFRKKLEHIGDVLQAKLENINSILNGENST